jgi:GNAT superfamily N-acetyltransferase
MATHPVMVPPPGHVIQQYHDSDPPPPVIPRGFVDAMAVRKAVFVEEQGYPLEEEIDEDDAYSYHWVVYASVSSKSATPPPVQENVGEHQRRMSQGGNVPVGTVRLAPPPHGLHPASGSIDGVGGKTDVVRVPGGDQATKFHDGKEPYVKLGRMATVKDFRGVGLGRLVVNAALDWVSMHKQDVETAPKDPIEKERIGKEAEQMEWKGLVMAHSQVDKIKFYENLGFEVDEELGEWLEGSESRFIPDLREAARY